MTLVTEPQTAAPTLPEQAALLLGHIAGYSAHRTIAMGLRQGLIDRFAQAPGSSAAGAARVLGFDEEYVAVWCRSALAAGVLARTDEGYAVEPHVATLLLDRSSPAFVGGVFLVTESEEMFPRFEATLRSGRRMWWRDTSPEWIDEVAGTGTPFYTRLVPAGLARVPGLQAELERGCRVVDTACGAGVGVVKLARAYPRCTVLGVDGDPHSIELARDRVAEAGLADRVELLCRPLEQLALPTPARVIINNISMHECRDIDLVAENVRRSLEPGGWFVISDFPFPDTDTGLRTAPGRIMCAIQFFEAQIDDQLLPRSAYDDLLTRHGFRDLGSASITPMHAITWGRA